MNPFCQMQSFRYLELAARGLLAIKICKLAKSMEFKLMLKSWKKQQLRWAMKEYFKESRPFW